MLLAYARESEVTGRFLEAIDARAEAVELYAVAGDEVASAHARSMMTLPLVRAARNDEAEYASRTAIEQLEALRADRELAYAYADQAYIRMISRDNADGAAWAKKAMDAARELGDLDLLSYALNMHGTSRMMAGEIERGIDYLLESLELARREGLDYRVYAALGMLGSGLAEMYELERGERYGRECIAFAEAHDFTPTYAPSWQALVQVYRGLWEEGAAAAVDVLRGPIEPITRITASIALGRARARRGDPGAFDALDEALELALPGGHLQRLGHVHAARAEAAWLVGDPERAAEEARAAYELALEKRHLWFAGELAYWQWKAGALDDAPDWIAEPYRLQLDGRRPRRGRGLARAALPLRGGADARRRRRRGGARRARAARRAPRARLAPPPPRSPRSACGDARQPSGPDLA